MAPPEGLNQLLLLTSSASDDDDDDCESLTAVTVCKSSSKWDCDDANAALPSKGHEKINGFVLAVLILFSTAGGPFGVEFSLKAAGNFYTIIGFAVMPFILSIPEAVMTYELSSLYPCASGGVRFTKEAFGEVWGLLVGYLGWIAGIAHISSLPILFLSFVQHQFFPQVFSPDDSVLFYGILASISAVLTYVNYRGLDVVANATILIFFFTLAPFVLLVIIGIPKVDPMKWLQTPSGEVDIVHADSLRVKGWFPMPTIAGVALRPFINNLFWKFNGFDQASHYSTTVSRKTLRNGLAGSILLVSSILLIPILIITGATDIEQHEWKAGSFAKAGNEIGGRWLGNWIVCSAGVCLLAQFLSDMAAESMMIESLATQGHIPSIFGRLSPHNTPAYAILLGLLVILAFLPFPIGVVIELSNFSACLSLLVEFLAFGNLMICRGVGVSWFRKTIYAILIFVALLFIITVILLASYAVYIFATVVLAFGVLIISTRKRESSHCFLSFSSISKKEYIPSYFQ